MRLLCALSNEPASKPVISPVSGYLFEQEEICEYLRQNGNRDPINGDPLEEDQLIPLNEASLKDAAVKQEEDCSLSELVRLLQEQWDAMTLERFKLNKDVNRLNKEVNQLTKQLAASVRDRDREKEVLLSQQNELYKIIDILNSKLTKYRALDEERKRSSSSEQSKNDNAYTNLPSIDNKENIFSSSINSSNGSSFRYGEHADHGGRFGHLSSHQSSHQSGHQPGHCLKAGSGHHSPNFSSINSKFSDTNVYFNEHPLGFASKFDDLPSPKFNALMGPKFADHLPSGAKFSALPSPKLESFANSKFFDLTNCKSSTLRSPKCGSKVASTGDHSPNSFQKYNKLSYSTEYVNLNGNLNSNRLFDRNHRTQSVIIQNDTPFDNELASMRSCEENLNCRAANAFLITPSSSGSLKRYGSNGSTFNHTMSSHCSNNYVNTGPSRAEEGIYCNLPAVGGEFADPAGLTSRRPKSTMTNYENILMFDDGPRNGPSKQLENCTRPEKAEAKNGQGELIGELRPEMKKNAKEDCSAKVSNIESWSKDFKNLLNDRIGKMAFSNFLKLEHSNENIEFWDACEEYKSLASREARKKKAELIYKTYFKSDNKINIDAKARGEVQASYHEAKSNDLPTNLFDVAQAQIYKLMLDHSYRRFLDSDAYKEALKDKDKRLPIEIFNPVLPTTNKPNKRKSIGKALGKTITRKLLK